MTNIVEEYKADSISEYIKIIEELEFEDHLQVYFRGEPQDFKETAFQPSVYRDNNLKSEHLRYREIQRFNDSDFTGDKTTLDKLSRMQHHLLPTRLIDLSEDALTSLYFAVSVDEEKDSVVYLVGINKEKIKYYDSDTVLVLSNLAKIPLENHNDKSKRKLHAVANDSFGHENRESVTWFNNENHAPGYLLHEIREDKSHLQPLIDPKHIFSIQCVKPKLSNNRIYGQKGAFLIFGLNSDDLEKSIPVLDYETDKPILHKNDRHQTPIERIVKIKISSKISLKDLSKLGITMPYIYTGLEKVSEYLKKI